MCEAGRLYAGVIHRTSCCNVTDYHEAVVMQTPLCGKTLHEERFFFRWYLLSFFKLWTGRDLHTCLLDEHQAERRGKCVFASAVWLGNFLYRLVFFWLEGATVTCLVWVIYFCLSDSFRSAQSNRNVESCWYHYHLHHHWQPPCARHFCALCRRGLIKSSWTIVPTS